MPIWSIGFPTNELSFLWESFEPRYDSGPQSPAVGMLPVCVTPNPGLTFQKSVRTSQAIRPLELGTIGKSRWGKSRLFWSLIFYDDDKDIPRKVGPKCKRQHIYHSCLFKLVVHPKSTKIFSGWNGLIQVGFPSIYFRFALVKKSRYSRSSWIALSTALFKPSTWDRFYQSMETQELHSEPIPLWIIFLILYFNQLEFPNITNG